MLDNEPSLIAGGFSRNCRLKYTRFRSPYVIFHRGYRADAARSKQPRTSEMRIGRDMTLPSYRRTYSHCNTYAITTADVVITEMLNPDANALSAKLARARSAIGKGIEYRLGMGGLRPMDPLPTRNGELDCSGFVAWVLGISRKPKKGRPWWFETTNAFRDAIGDKSTLVRIPKPIPGCVVVFPDYTREGRHREGHIGIVSKVHPDGSFDVVDCASKGVTEQTGAYFTKHQAIFCALKQDLKP